uniref:NADH-ubiquinone oxidoreductase chain 3 n=1 Tax=Eumacrocentrus sp. QL-2013 TaxID=1421594 RepID=A0A0A6ZKX2_9HYME|nr:NADH dehydrogenase subunit 3 [Eumacrocentrus sp. QL-2013]
MMNNLMLMILFNIFISFFFLLLNYMISKKKMLMREKNSSFECGFDSFISSRLPFSIHFYLISILFLIFDVEIILLFPLINSLNLLNYYNWLFSSLMVLIILYLGLEYEKNEGSLKWFI